MDCTMYINSKSHCTCPFKQKDTLTSLHSTIISAPSLCLYNGQSAVSISGCYQVVQFAPFDTEWHPPKETRLKKGSNGARRRKAAAPIPSKTRVAAVVTIEDAGVAAAAEAEARRNCEGSRRTRTTSGRPRRCPGSSGTARSPRASRCAPTAMCASTSL